MQASQMTMKLVAEWNCEPHECGYVFTLLIQEPSTSGSMIMTPIEGIYAFHVSSKPLCLLVYGSVLASNTNIQYSGKPWQALHLAILAKN